MKKVLSIFLILFPVFFLPNLRAQQPPMSKEEFRSRQQEFITRRAGLTQEEAQKFFPLYFELQDKKGKLNRKAWQNMRQGKDPNTTEAEYARIVEDMIQARITNDKLDLEYVRKYKKFLSAKKIYDIQKAEMRFHRELLKSAHHGEKGRPGNKEKR